MVRRALLFAGLVAVAGYVAIAVVGAEMIPGYSHFSSPISEMTAEGGAIKAVLDPWLILLNAMVVAFASALPASVRSRDGGLWVYARGGAAFLAFAGVLGIIMTLWFPMDASAMITTVIGTIHDIIAGSITVCSMLAILLFGIGFRSSVGWGGFALYSFATFAFASSCSIAAAYTIASGSDSQGAWQRLAAGVIIQWIFVVALKALSTRDS